MMEDIAPALIEKIQQDFERRMKAEPDIARLLQAIADGSRSYTDALNLGDELGVALKDAFADGLTAGALPDDTLYYNIAKRLIEQVGGSTFDLAQTAAEKVQESINSAAGIGLNVVTPDTKAGRLNDLVNTVAGKPLEECITDLKKAIQELPQGAVRDTMQANMEFQGKAGLHARIVRTYHKGKHDCEYCASLAKTYEYPVENTDAYRRHPNCRCSLEYMVNGKKGKTLWSSGDKAQQRAQEQAKEARIEKYNAMAAAEKKKADAQAAERKKIAARKEPENVLPEYLRNATPKVGEVIYSDGYTSSHHAEEIKTAQWLHEKFGGDIVLLTESFDAKTPDFLWREQYWELKNISSEKAADSAMRGALKQITEIPGGVILDCNCNISEKMQDIVEHRFLRGHEEKIDVMFLRNGELSKILRYKK